MAEALAYVAALVLVCLIVRAFGGHRLAGSRARELFTRDQPHEPAPVLRLPSEAERLRRLYEQHRRLYGAQARAWIAAGRHIAAGGEL